MTNNDKQSRRDFLKKGGLLAGGLIGGSVLTSFISFEKPLPKEDKLPDFQHARLFFDRKEDFNVLSAATERIFPEDRLGPGAISLGVPYFIDKQLFGTWGSNTDEYMKGPFPIDSYTRSYESKTVKQSKQGPNAEVLPGIIGARYQTRLNRGEIILLGIRYLNDYSLKNYNERFDELASENQDDILKQFEDNKVQLPGVEAQTFFYLLVQLTVEGAYADPVYGGNKNMAGWKMKQYPGPRAAYINDIEANDFIKMDQQSLTQYQGEE